MALHLHRASRADVLASALADLVSSPLPDEFATEVVVVPARGVERWLSQSLSHRLGAAPGSGDGVCAGIAFRTPWSLIAEIAGTRDADPWAPDRLAWPLLEVIDASVDEPWAGTLAQHIGHGLSGEEAELRRGRRYAVARRLAHLFASYAVQRPEVLADWSNGDDTDGCGRPLDTDLAWQPEVWRRLAARVDGVAPHERHAETLRRLRDGAAGSASVDLPGRLSLFGHTRLPRTEVELLTALAEHRDVHLWLPHPSAALWQELAPVTAVGAVPRVEDDSHHHVRHPLLATLGRDVRELQRGLAAAGPHVLDAALPDPEAPTTLLGWLQSDLRADRVGPAGERPVVPSDRSVQVHACHGRARQVEVLREVLLGLLADDPTLEPRDVLVMCPDIETFAPLISAGFGLGDVLGDAGHPAHGLRVRLADRALTRTNPLLDVASRLLDLAGGRAAASTVLDLAHAEPVRARFGFTDDDLEQVTAWVQEAGVRWGFDAEHREDFGLEEYVANTWEFGLDRLLAGVAMSDDSPGWLDRTLPLDDVGSGQIDLVGRFTEFLHRLRRATDDLEGERSLDQWLQLLAAAVASLAEAPRGEEWQEAQVQRELARVAVSAEGLTATSLRLADVRALLRDVLGGRPTRANFRTGTLTVCTMVPMRSVPHRVVCLVGLDDGAFPRVGAVDGDDVLARHPMTGERNVRGEDRQLLLDAVLAATETLVITYTGANEYSGQRRPPAVPLGELLDALDVTATAPTGSVSDAVTVHHPLQPFDVRNVAPGALVPGRPFVFDRAALAGARAASGPRAPRPAFLPGPLPPGPRGDVSLDELAAWLKNPVRDFFRTRLDLALPRDAEAVEDALPIELGHLETWSVGDRVLRDVLAGRSVDEVRQREWRRGVLPPRQLGWRRLREIVDIAQPLAEEARPLRSASPRAIDVDLDLGGGRRLRGTVPEVHGDRLVSVGYSRLGASHRLQSWVQVLALSASDADHNFTAHTIGRAPHGSGVATSLLGPVTDRDARDVLRDLVDLRDRGLCEPLPLPLKASFAYVVKRRTNVTPDQAVYAIGWDWELEGDAPEHQRAWGVGAKLPGTTVPPAAGEEWPGEDMRFGALAMRLWMPLLDAEQGRW